MDSYDIKTYKRFKKENEALLLALEPIIEDFKKSDCDLFRSVSLAYENAKSKLEELAVFGSCEHEEGTSKYVGEAYGNDIYHIHCYKCGKFMRSER